MTRPKRTQERHKASPRKFKSSEQWIAIAQNSKRQAQDRCSMDYTQSKTAQDSTQTPFNGARDTPKRAQTNPRQLDVVQDRQRHAQAKPRQAPKTIGRPRDASSCYLKFLRYSFRSTTPQALTKVKAAEIRLRRTVPAISFPE